MQPDVPAPPPTGLTALVERLERPAWVWWLVAAGLFLLVRVPALSRSFWLDECFAADAASRTGGELVDWIRSVDTHPPGYYFALGAWMRLAPGDVGLRLLSLAFNALHLLVLVATAGALWGRRAALLCALLASVSPALAWPGYEVRSHALAALLVTAAWWFAVRALATGRLLPWLGVGLLAAASLYVFYYTAVGLFALGAFVLASRPARRDVLGLAGAGLLAALLFLPWLPVLVDQLGRVQAKTSAGVSGLHADLVWWWGWIVGHVVRSAPWSRLPVLGALLVLLVAARGRLWSDPAARPAIPGSARPWLRAAWIAVGAYLVGVVAMGAAGSFVRTIYATVLAGLWVLVAAGLLVRMRPCARVVGMAVLMVCGTYTSYRHARRAEVSDWRGAMAHVERVAEGGDGIFLVPAWEAVSYRRYAGSSAPSVLLPTDGATAMDALVTDDARASATLAALLAGRTGVWVVISGEEPHGGPDRRAERWGGLLRALGWESMQTALRTGLRLERWQRR